MLGDGCFGVSQGDNRQSEPQFFDGPDHRISSTEDRWLQRAQFDYQITKYAIN
jgi:hypothetical protein